MFILSYSGLLFCVPDAWLFCIAVNLVIHVSLGLLYSFVVLSPGFDFCFLSTSQEIGWEEHLRNDLFCVEWDVRPLNTVKPVYRKATGVCEHAPLAREISHRNVAIFHDEFITRLLLNLNVKETSKSVLIR